MGDSLQQILNLRCFKNCRVTRSMSFSLKTQSKIMRSKSFHISRIFWCPRTISNGSQAKVQRGEYTTLKDLKDDADLMCKNCMVYNSDDTIFYKVRNFLRRSEHNHESHGPFGDAREPALTPRMRAHSLCCNARLLSTIHFDQLFWNLFYNYTHTSIERLW